jgi:hypothetical protein
MSSSSITIRDLKIFQKGASLAGKGRNRQEIHPVDLDRDSYTPSPVRIVAKRPRYLSSRQGTGPFIVGIVIRSIDSW